MLVSVANGSVAIFAPSRHIPTQTTGAEATKESRSSGEARERIIGVSPSFASHPFPPFFIHDANHETPSFFFFFSSGGGGGAPIPTATVRFGGGSTDDGSVGATAVPREDGGAMLRRAGSGY